MLQVPHQLDHLVFAGPDLREAIELVQNRLGVSLLPGGRHSEWGTCNAILPLGPSSYLEVIGPDPDIPPSQRPQLFGIASRPGPRLVTWAAKATNLARLTEDAQSQGIELGSVSRGSRQRPDGTMLTWELTDPFADRAGGVLPFFIDWSSGSHPAAMAPAEVSLLSLTAQHPEARTITTQLAKLGIELEVEAWPVPSLIAKFKSPAGEPILL